MKHFCALPAAVLASLWVFLMLNAPSVASAETDLQPTQVVLGTATPGGGFQLFGQHLAEVINAIEPSLRVAPVATRRPKTPRSKCRLRSCTQGWCGISGKRVSLDGLECGDRSSSTNSCELNPCETDNEAVSAGTMKNDSDAARLD